MDDFSMDWAHQRTPEELRADMIEGAKMFGMSPEMAERLIAYLTGEKPMTDREMVRAVIDSHKPKDSK